MDEKCKSCKNEEACRNDSGMQCIPFYDHQHTMMHYNWVNRRSMISLIAVCITMIIVVFIFATNQTRREEMWQETIKSLYQTTAPEVENGQQDSDP